MPAFLGNRSISRILLGSISVGALAVGLKAIPLTPSAPSAPTVYDTAIGTDVDSSGHASLPLYAGGTTGTDALTGTPTVASGVTYAAGTRTVSGSTPFNTTLASWSGVTTPGQTYRLQLGIIKTGYTGFQIKDENGTVSWTRGSNGVGDQQFWFIDETFVATGTDVNLYAFNDAFNGEVRFGILAPHSGDIPAHRFYVNTAGSDTINPVAALDPATPLASAAQAVKLVIPGSGDQILIAEGKSYSWPLPQVSLLHGRSPVYPFVIQTYDDADPTNEAKLGRPATGNRPKVNTGGATAQALTSSSYINFLAIRGLDFDPGDLANAELSFSAPSGGPFNTYVLIENCILRNTQLSQTQGSQNLNVATKFILRGNSLHGGWGSNRAEGFFINGTAGVTIEDNVINHCGWRPGASRDDDYTLGGVWGGGQQHPVYVQNDCSALIYRRNLVVDGASDGGHLLCDAEVYDNLIIDCPIPLDMTGGVSYETIRPDGVDYQVYYNAILGSADINSTAPRGYGIVTRNGSSGSSVHDNLIVRVNDINGFNRDTYSTSADFGKPSYMDFYDNVSFLRSLSGNTHFEFPDNTTTPPSDVFTTYSNNIWDDPTDGNGNVQATAAMFPNPYTDAQLYAAWGYANKASLMTYASEHPEAFVQRTGLNLLMAGYGIDHQIEAAPPAPISDTTAPTLTSATGAATGPDTGSLGVTTDEGSGTLYAVVTTSASAPTSAQVKLGQDSDGIAAAFAGNQAVTASGVQSMSATGLTASTGYCAHFMHEDAAANQSAVVSSATFTTAAGGTLGPELVLNGDFSDPASWIIGTGWVVTGGQGAGTNASDWLWQNNSIQAGHTYRVTYTISGYSAGSIRAYAGGSGTTAFGTARSANGTFTQDITATGTGDLGFLSSGFTGNVDNFSVKEVL